MFGLDTLETTTTDSRHTPNSNTTGACRTVATATANFSTTTVHNGSVQYAAPAQTVAETLPVVILEPRDLQSDATVKAARPSTATQPVTQSQTQFVRPAAVPAPVKSMATHRGKSINRGQTAYVRNESDGTDTVDEDRYYENHAPMDGRQSTGSERSADEWTKEKEIDSPVKGESLENSSRSGASKKNKKRRRHRDSSSSSGSSSERPPKRSTRETQSCDTEKERRRSKKSSRHGDGRRGEQGKTRRTHDRTPERSQSRPRSVSRAPSVPAVSPVKSGGSNSSRHHGSRSVRRTTDSEEGRPTVDRSPPYSAGRPSLEPGMDGTTASPPPPTPRPPAEPSTSTGKTTTTPHRRRAASVKAGHTVTESLNNMVYSAILDDKSERPSRQDADNMSRSVCSVRSNATQRPLQTRKPLDSEALETYLMAELRGTELSRETTRHMLHRCKGTAAARSKFLADMMSYITYARAEPNDHPEPQHRIQVDTKNYLLYSLETGFGYDFDTCNSKKPLVRESLLYALWADKYCDKEHSLDRVLRSALRDIVREDESNRCTGVFSAPFVNGRSLELRMLQKIKQYYYKHFGKDIIRCLMPSNMEEEESELQALVAECSSRNYVRRMVGLYGMNPTNFDQVTEQTISTPKEMRVWTDKRTQRSVNVQLKAHIEAVLEDHRREWEAMDRHEREGVKRSRRFVQMYVEKTKAFMISHGEFLSWVLRASELTAWMCFGVTTNHDELGSELMALSYLLARNESKTGIESQKLCWNYPLASMFFQEEPAASKELPCKLGVETYKDLDGLDLDF